MLLIVFTKIGVVFLRNGLNAEQVGVAERGGV